MFNYREFLESLPKKRMASGCLLFDEQGRVMMVRPIYKTDWEIPGGIVELNESPRQCCQREVHEELGLDRETGELLVVDYSNATTEETEALHFIFMGGILTEAEIASITLLSKELAGFDFFAIESLPNDTSAALKKRIMAAWKQAATRVCVYLEDQNQL